VNRRAIGAFTAAAAAALAIAWRARPGASLRGDVALVTGGSRGLGFLLARQLLDEGCRVAICARDTHTLDRARRRLEAETSGEVAAFVCDVADADAVERLVDDVVARFGGLSIVVNNAAVIQVAPLDTLEIEDFRSAIDIALMGMVHTTFAALPHLRRARGRIANITSIGGKIAVPHLLPYDCAKFAAVGFSEGLRSELAGSGVRVTTVIPGLMRTGSPVHVEYRGDPAREYAWFTLGDLLPLSAMSAERAARRIVRAIRHGETELVLTWQARALRLAHDLAPATVTRALGVVNRLLPRSSQGTDTKPTRAARAKGAALRGTLPRPAEAALDRAARRSNQI